MYKFYNILQESCFVICLNLSAIVFVFFKDDMGFDLRVLNTVMAAMAGLSRGMFRTINLLPASKGFPGLAASRFVPKVDFKLLQICLLLLSKKYTLLLLSFHMSDLQSVEVLRPTLLTPPAVCMYRGKVYCGCVTTLLTNIHNLRSLGRKVIFQ